MLRIASCISSQIKFCKTCLQVSKLSSPLNIIVFVKDPANGLFLDITDWEWLLVPIMVNTIVDPDNCTNGNDGNEKERLVYIRFEWGQYP